MPRFSVLLPTYNRVDVLPYAIQSVLDQTEADFELLVVNDGSTDGTAELEHQFGDRRIRWFNLPKAPNFGYANRNVALREARGDLIAFAAHDDLLFPDHLALLGERFHNPKIELTYSMPLWAMPDGILLPVPGNLEFPDELERFLGSANFMPAYCVMHRRCCLERYGYWPEDVASAGDWHVWKAIIMGGGRSNFAYVPVPTGMHFKAVWRARSAVGAEAMAKIAAEAAWWPASLKPQLQGGRPEQADFAEMLQACPCEWVSHLRSGVNAALGRLVLDQIHSWEQSRKELGNLIDKIVYLESLLKQHDNFIDNTAHALSTFSHNILSGFQDLHKTPPPEFDEGAYLTNNPDVAAAVARGIYPTGFDHWCRTRQRETRTLR